MWAVAVLGAHSGYREVSSPPTVGFHVSLKLFPLNNTLRIENHEKYSYSPKESQVEVSFNIDLHLLNSIYSHFKYRP